LTGLSLVVAFQLLREAIRGEVRPIDLLVHPRWYLLLPGLLVLAIWLRERTPTRGRRTWALALGFAALAWLAVGAFHPEGPIANYRSYRKRAADAGPVDRVRGTANRLTTHVLCDYSTCQAFPDFAHVVHMATIQGQRGFPRRLPIVPEERARELHEAFEVGVIEVRHREQMEHLLGEGLQVIEESGTFVAFESRSRGANAEPRWRPTAADSAAAELSGR
jgi:hypothetical protein